ncbi:MAG: ABC transporter permease [candidate division Zixibacteria bacterium]|nr:ABC transporter permease [candidate division Zixibacteria bacterium]
MTVFEVKEGIFMALVAIRANKMRSFLTVLGVLIGVASVIGMVSIITGLNNSMAEQIQSLGSNVIYISEYKPEVNMGGPATRERRKEITIEHAEAIRKYCPSVGAVSPENHYWATGGNKVKYKDKQASRPAVAGVLPDYEVVNNCFAVEGRFFTESDVNFRAFVAILGDDVKESLFPSVDPLGKEIRINNNRYGVIGVMEKKPKILGQSQDDYVLIPHSTYKKIYPEDKALSLAVRPKTPELTEKAIDEVRQLLRRMRGVAYDKPDDFAIFTQEDLMNIYEKVTSVIYLVMVVISSIGLLVGGVGVMNIMLVSVTERTREIGIRKAVGAKKKNILWQFLIEAMALSGAGGLLGILFGLAIAWIVKIATPLPAGVSVAWIIIGFSVSVSVGLIFGIYPAYRAVRVDPIVSLRYE